MSDIAPSGLVSPRDTPTWLVAAAKEAPHGLEEVKGMVLPSFLRIRQQQSDDELFAAAYVGGDVVIMPDNIPIHTRALGKKPIDFTPVFAWTEYCKWNPRGVQPWIVERTFDKDSNIARRSRDPKLRKEQDPTQPNNAKAIIKYMAHWNVLVHIRTQNGPGLPVIMPFVSAEFTTGKRFSNLIMGRSECPIYGGVYSFTVGKGVELAATNRENAEGKWYGFDITNAPEPFVTQQQFAIYQQWHKDYASKFQEGLLQPDYTAGMGEANTDDATQQTCPAGPQGPQGYEYSGGMPPEGGDPPF